MRPHPFVQYPITLNYARSFGRPNLALVGTQTQTGLLIDQLDCPMPCLYKAGGIGAAGAAMAAPLFGSRLKKNGKPKYPGWTALDVLQSWLTVSISYLGLCVWERVQNATPSFLLRRARPPHFKGAGAGPVIPLHVSKTVSLHCLMRISEIWE